jgi:hypothetical protein
MPPPTLNSTRVAPTGQPPVVRSSTNYTSKRSEKAIAAIESRSVQIQAAKKTDSTTGSASKDTANSKLNETKARRYEAVRYFSFVVLFCVSAFINHSNQLFWFKNAISNVVMSHDINSVVSRDSFWAFATNQDPGSFLNNFFAVVDRFDSSSNSSIKNMGSVFLISPLRIRTLRVKPESCFPKGFDSANLTYLFDVSKVCHPTFSLTTESKSDYGVGDTFSWKQDSMIGRNLIGDFGELAHYPGGGFSVDIEANNALEASIHLKSLQQSQFIDSNTSYVAFEFNVFAPIAMAYLPTRIYFEFPSIGGAIMGSQLSPAIIFRYASDEGRIIQAVDAVLIVYFIMSCLMTVKAFWRQGFLIYLRLSPWNTFDILSNLSLMVNLGLRFNMHQDAQALNLSNPKKFTEISLFVVYERAITAANAFTLLMVLIRVCFYYGRYVPKAKLIISACQYALFHLFVCVAFLLATFLAFALTFYACFGSDIASYRSFGLSCLAMLKALMGNTDDMIDIPNSGFPVIGPILIGSFSISMYFILTNMFAAILVDAFAATKGIWKQQEKVALEKRFSVQKESVGVLKQKFEDDLSGDDVIDRNELKGIVEMYKDLLGFDTVDEFLKRYDDNGDGVITRAELAPVLNKLDADLAAIKNEGAELRSAITSDGMIELFETFDQSLDDKLSNYTESLMRMIEQRSFGAGTSSAMGMGFEGGQGVIPVQPNRPKDLLAPENFVTSLIGTVKAKSQFLTLKNRNVVVSTKQKSISFRTSQIFRFNQKKLSTSSPESSSPAKGSQRQRFDDESDLEATLGPQHGKFQANMPEIEELKLRVEALQAQVSTSPLLCFIHE